MEDDTHKGCSKLGGTTRRKELPADVCGSRGQRPNGWRGQHSITRHHRSTQGSGLDPGKREREVVGFNPGLPMLTKVSLGCHL